MKILVVSIGLCSDFVGTRLSLLSGARLRDHHGLVVNNPEIVLRNVSPEDVEVFFQHQLDPVAIAMVAFISKEPSDRVAFSDKWARLLRNEAVVARTVVVDGSVMGYVASFERLGKREIAYWLGRDVWGRGVATESVRKLLLEVTARPVYARVATEHAASLRVLQKNDFTIVAQEKSDNALGQPVVEHLLELRGAPPTAE